MNLAAQTHHARSLGQQARKSLALKVLKGDNISHLAETNSVSRKFIYQQKHIALSGIDKTFETSKQEKAFFYIPVNRHFIYMAIVVLILCCRSSYRGAMAAIKILFDIDVSLGTIHNVIAKVIDRAREINSQYDLGPIKHATNDEWFMNDKPIFTGVDIDSRFCYLLQENDTRDGDTWAIRLMELEDKGYAPNTIILDFGKGINNGHQQVMSSISILCNDQFHTLKKAKDTLRFFRNRLASTETAYIKALDKFNKGQLSRYQVDKLCKAIERLSAIINTLAILLSWVEHDIFPLIGYNPTDKSELYDLVFEQLQQLSDKFKEERLQQLAKHFKTYKLPLLKSATLLNEKLIALAQRYQCSLDYLWQIVRLQRYDINGPRYHEIASTLEMQWPTYFDDIEDNVKQLINDCHRTSSMIENLNSRIAPYIELRKQLGKNYLPLLQFFLNHSVFMRSVDSNIKGKSPAELMSGKPHLHWIEMLGFKRFVRPQKANAC